MQVRLMWVQGKRECRLADWRRVLWSDECDFQLLKRNGGVRVWRQTGERYQQDCVVPKFASGRISVTVWGCVSDECKLDLVDIGGDLNAQRYVDEILGPHVEPHVGNHRLMGRPIDMQDGATPHTARLSQEYIHWAAVDVMLWPSMSPNLNIIEDIWLYMSCHISMLPQLCPEMPSSFARLCTTHIVNGPQWANTTNVSILLSEIRLKLTRF